MRLSRFLSSGLFAASLMVAGVSFADVPASGGAGGTGGAASTGGASSGGSGSGAPQGSYRCNADWVDIDALPGCG